MGVEGNAAGPPRATGRVYVAAFLVSLLCISAELIFGVTLGLKAWSHMVYVVISFALLGYGIGSLLLLLAWRPVSRAAPDLILGGGLALVAIAFVVSLHFLLAVPIELRMIPDAFPAPRTWIRLHRLARVYASVAFPFAGVGFLITYVFTKYAGAGARLYFWDLLGAGAGAAAFSPLISLGGPCRGLVLLCAAVMAAGIACLDLRRRLRPAAGAMILVLASATGGSVALPEPNFVVDPSFGWECIPGHLKAGQYETLMTAWHPLGRTDLYRIKDREAQDTMYRDNRGSFEIPVDPRPDFCLFVNNYRAGTPAYDFSENGLSKHGSQVTPFSAGLEFPYIFLSKPAVMVIGAGGGRDIFMAKLHGAKRIIGAEINPATHAAMSPGGCAYELSGGMYGAPGVEIHNVDGRHLARVQPEGSCDLIVLNGVDTFAALSTGAYAFAETYLYTEEAVQDYLRALSDSGFIYFIRWFEDPPRETLKLFVIINEALKKVGVERPWEHIAVGRHGDWGVTLVKKTPFTTDEERRLLDYFQAHGTGVAHLPRGTVPGTGIDTFARFVEAYRENRVQPLIDSYTSDISSITDDSPYFYKNYRFTLSLFESPMSHPAGGNRMFFTHMVITLQTVFFIVVFMVAPLLIFRRKGLAVLSHARKLPFLGYFSCLGIGFIFIEIALMQKFTLLLGSPIHSISVILGSLLILTGVGSLLLDRLGQRLKPHGRWPAVLALWVATYLVAFVLWGAPAIDAAARAPFAVRVALCILMLIPLGIPLGAFFPAGLMRISRSHAGTVPWAWGINSGWTVLGSTLSIILAQTIGFKAVLILAAVAYILAGLMFRHLPGSQTDAPEGTP